MSALPLPPHPRDAGPVVGSVPSFRVDMMQAFLDGWQELGDVVRYRGPRTMYVMAHPDFARYVLHDNADNFHRTPFVTTNLVGLMRDGLFISKGELWQRQRPLLESVFEADPVATLAGSIVAGVNAMLERWDSASSSLIDVCSEMMRLNLDITGRALFGDDEAGKRAAMAPAITTAAEYCIPKVMALANPPDRVKPGYRRFVTALATLDRIVDDAIADRRREPTGDLVSMLAHATDSQSGATMDGRILRDEIITSMFGAYKGPSQALPWIWYLLSLHPDVGRRVRQEIRDVLGDREPTVDDLLKLQVTTMVVKESLRLYPPLWALPREALADDAVGGYAIPKGATVVVSPYLVHRHPEFWDDPEGFDPDRFTPERSAGRHPDAYLPFADGPRSCLGEHYSLMLLTLVTAAVAQRYKLALVPGHVIKRRREFLLRSISGMPARLEAIG